MNPKTACLGKRRNPEEIGKFKRISLMMPDARGLIFKSCHRTCYNRIFRTRYETSASMLESIQSNDERV